MNVLIVYYSTYGNVYHMATLVAEGVKEIPGAQPVVRTVPELIPQSVIDAREDMKAGSEIQQDEGAQLGSSHVIIKSNLGSRLVITHFGRMKNEHHFAAVAGIWSIWLLRSVSCVWFDERERQRTHLGGIGLFCP